MLYKVCIRQQTECIGDITANTLFGAFLTAYSSLYQIDDKLIRDITLSDLFNEGVLPSGVKDNKTQYNKKAQNIETLVQRTYIARSIEDNNAVNVARGWVGKNKNFEFYLSTNMLDKAELEKIIPVMLEIGIGKWRAVGKGMFKLVEITEFTPAVNSDVFIALSSFNPKENVDLNDVQEAGYTIRDTIATNGSKQDIIPLLLTGTTFKKCYQIVGAHIFDKKSQTYVHGQSIVICLT